MLSLSMVVLNTIDPENFVVKKISYQPFFNKVKVHEIFKIIIFN